MATGRQFPIEGYKEALGLLLEWQKSPKTYRGTTGLIYCAHCDRLSPSVKHKPDCLVSRTRKLLETPQSLPELPDETNFSSPGPPPF